MFYFKIVFLIVPIIGFSWIFYNEQFSIEKVKSFTCGDLLNEDYLENVFEDINIIPLTEYAKKSNNNESCGYRFSIGNKYYDASLTLGILGNATEEMFDDLLLGIEDKKILMGWEEKAYIYPLGLAHEVTIFAKESFIHGYLIEENNESLFLDKVLTKKLLYGLLERLELP